MSGKVLDQSVFEGLPPEFKWAVVCEDGKAVAHVKEPFNHMGDLRWFGKRGNSTRLIGDGYDARNFQQSKIKREMLLDNFPRVVTTDCAAISSFASALREKRNFAELHGAFRATCPDEDLSAKEKIALALNKHKKPVLCVVDNDGPKTIAFIESIGVSSGHYIDSFCHSWVNAEPVEAEFEFTVVGRGIV